MIIFVVLLTTARHEGSHALVAWAQGATIHEVRLLPGVNPDLGFYFGYVSRDDGGTWLIDAAPFGAALIWFGAAFLMLKRLPRTSGSWMPLFVVGTISPLADLIYNYQGGLWRHGTDVKELLAALPNLFVHLFFVVAIGTCVVGILHLRRSNQFLVAN
ncbi:MAG: hypothetical protein OEO82_01585 [Gammaproteobacteria bacterium]|nr:hypothetical protein [Gammaproteobacteria bacterium]